MMETKKDLCRSIAEMLMGLDHRQLELFSFLVKQISEYKEPKQ